MTNALAGSLSPYLLQHAENPVDWQPWGLAPFEEAKRRQVPVFVSIGYATCHWCHVMARESFSDPGIAKLLNEHFVAIKVDREEHPEVDSTYMAMASAFSQNLGWPLNVFVTPEGKAFFAGTYWPPDAMAGHPSFRQILSRVIEAWESQRGDVEQTAGAIAEAIAGQSNLGAGSLPGSAELAAVVAELGRSEDPEFGGFGTAPKFPQVPTIDFLLTEGSAEALGIAERALVAMAQSELRDKIEGGFFRYATKRDWSVPHFERMLYDNAQLLGSYSRLALVSEKHRDLALEVANGIADFLMKVLRVQGGLASAQNSESIVDGYLTEGDYYSLDAEARSKQSPPELDAKVLTGWNGLAINSLALAGSALGRPDWVAFAVELAGSILENQRQPDGSLARASLNGRVSVASAVLEDYGLLARGLVQLAIATGEPKWAVQARELVVACLGEDGFRAAGAADSTLSKLGLNSEIDPTEGPFPSGPVVLADTSRLLYALGAERKFLQAAIAQAEQNAGFSLKHPLGFAGNLRLAADLAAGNSQLVVVYPQSATDSAAGLVEFVRKFERAGCTSIAVTDEQSGKWVESGFGLFEGRGSNSKPATAYFCEDFVCRLPVDDLVALEDLLG
ncbi:MAG: thioredoxin domain-containing protein [Cryobacterium sp.]|nr:thioredoxin domain-containing protein [Cryobacterium sp.]